ncbi:MAG: hypothetical protein E6G51_02440 [Actinobacteria bacterium]|nr:MAG: hypothetical protein E6G51_02440 [Actinomycetota bacterium]
MPAAARLQLIGCALLAALLLAGCGGGDSDSTGAVTVISSKDGRFQNRPAPSEEKSGNDAGAAATTEDPKPHVPAGDLCQSQLGGFVGSMDGLRRRLAVGVTYDQYVAEVRGIRSTYGEIPIDKLQVDCLASVATPSEKAFNRYIESANAWGECVSELGCGTTEIEPVLQRRWRVASHFLSEAQDGLQAIAR